MDNGALQGTGMDQLLYRPEEVAHLCAVGRTTIYAAIREGRIESVKIGAARRVTREAVLRYIEALRNAQSR